MNAHASPSRTPTPVARPPAPPYRLVPLGRCLAGPAMPNAQFRRIEARGESK